ncbi:MAG: hypothetical protein ACE5IY_07590 [bacterium]
MAKKKDSGSGVRTVMSELQLGAVPTYRSTLDKLSNELARVRRYNRPLSMVVLRLESDQLLIDLKRSLVAETGNGGVESYNQVMQTIQLVFSLVGSILKESLRESDIATYDVSNNQYIIMLPESNREQAALTVTRLKRLLFKRTAGHLVAGLAEFPTDGLIIDDLVKGAVAACNKTNGELLVNKGAKETELTSEQDKDDEES